MLVCFAHSGLYVCCDVVRACRRLIVWCFFFQAEDGIRDLVRSRGLGDVYKRQRVGSIDQHFVGHFATHDGGGRV